MLSQNHPQFSEEINYLKYTLNHLKKFLSKISSEKSEIDKKVEYGIRHYNSDNAEQFNELTINEAFQDYLGQKVTQSVKALKKPYFARVDFLPDNELKQTMYIGKTTLMREEDQSLIIVDWRAPISTLYYEGRLGRSSYECSDGVISGEMLVKRQYIIENGVLNEIFDIDITTNDDFLQASLNSSKDKRLKDIVSTIQAEQNKIIRAPMFSPLVVQGAAGGGKTTIALHRIAYLLYAFETKILPKNIMIIAPNKFFLSYISEVLPDLGVESVLQTTFEEFAEKFIEKKLKIKSSVEKLGTIITQPNIREDIIQVSKFKSSLMLKEMIEKYSRHIMSSMLPKHDLEIEGYVIFPLESVVHLAMEAYIYLPFVKRMSEIKKYIYNSLKRELPKILEYIDVKYDIEKEKIKLEMDDTEERRNIIIKLLDERDKKLVQTKLKHKTLLKNYIKQMKSFDAIAYYKDFFQNENLFIKIAAEAAPDISAKDINKIRTATLSVLDTGCVELEDIAAIMYLKYIFCGFEEKQPIKHIVIDEAQDFSLFQLFSLKTIMGSNSFSVLGDLAQGIYSYKGIEDWNDVIELFGKDTQYMTLEQSYRTTIEIMNKANEAAKHLNIGLSLAKPVIRHGSEVQLIQTSNISSTIKDIENKISLYKQDNYKSFAIICKTLNECREIKSIINTDATIITGQETDFSGGTVIIPSYVVKGLEFDVVFVCSANEEVFTPTELDTKLLYISMTRALHELIIYFNGNLTPLLNYHKS